MRLSARAKPLRSISQPQWRFPIAQQRCGFSLFHATFPPENRPLLSRREIIDFSPVDFYKSPSEIQIHLRNYDGSKYIGKMSLYKALNFYSRPGKLLLPIPRPKDSWKGPPISFPQQYFFRSIDIKKVQGHIKRTRQPEIFHFFPSANTTSFEESMARIWVSLLKGFRVEIQVHREGPKDVSEFKKMLNAKIYLRPDVIRASMPPKSEIIIDPQTNYETACWVIGPSFKDEYQVPVKPFSEMGEFYKRRKEVLVALQELNDERVGGNQ